MKAATCAILLSLVAGIAAQELPRLTIDDWLEGKSHSKPIPRGMWTKGGLLLSERGNPIPIRYNTLTGDRTPLFDREWIAKAVFVPDNSRGQNSPSPVPGDLLELSPDAKKGLFELLRPRRQRTESIGYVVADFQEKTVTRIIGYPEAKNFQFSPDASQLAFVAKSNLYVADLKSNQAEATELTNDGSETLLNGTLNWVYWEEIFGRRDIGFWWSPDSKSIAYLQTDQSGITPTYFPDPREKLETPIKQYYPRAGTPNPKVKVGIANVTTKKTNWVDIPPTTYEYILRVKWLPTSQELAVITMNRPQTDVELLLAPKTGGPAKTLLKEHDSAYVNVTDDLTFLKNGDFIWASEKTGYYHLYRYDANGKELNAITKGGWGLVSNPGPAFWVRQSISKVDETNGWVYFTSNKDDSIQRHLYRAKLDGSKYEKVTKEPGVHAINFDPHADRYLDTYSNLKTPPALILADPQGSRIPIQDPDEELKERVHIDLPEFTTIPARDRFPMPALIRRPRDFKEGGGKKYPVIIYCYGGPSAPSVKHEWDDPGWDQVLLDEGYAVVVVDNRTATSISKKLEASSVKEYMGKVELNDLVDAARWLKTQEWVDPGRIGVWGWSNGGTYTLLGMTRSTEFKAGIAVAAVTDMSIYDSKWAESIMKGPAQNPAGYEEVRLDKYAKDLSGRLLLVHGTYDDNVHPQHAWRFVDELIKANKQFDLMMYPMRMHGISDAPARKHLYTTMLEFWKRWL